MANHVLRDRIWESKKLRQCSRQAAMAYPWIFLVADDWGRFEYDPQRIWTKVFGSRQDVTLPEVTAWLAEYEEVGLLRRYAEDDELAYWTKFVGRPPSQRRESDYPDPEEVKPKKRATPKPKDSPRGVLGDGYVPPTDKVGDPLLEIDRIGSDQSGADQRNGPRPSAGAEALIPTTVSWTTQAGEDWTAGSGGVPEYGRIGKALKPLIDQVAKDRGIAFDEAWLRVRPVWQAYCRSPDRRFGPEEFARNPKRVVEVNGRPTIATQNEAARREAVALAQKRKAGAQ